MDRPSAGLQTAKNVLSYSSRQILSQHPRHTPQSGYHGINKVAKSANIGKMAEKGINCKALVPLNPIQTPWSRDPETLFRLKIEKTKRFMIFDPKKRGGQFLDISPPPPPPPPSKAQKSGYQVGGGPGGSGQKNSLGDAFIGQNTDFTRG